jgi:hypothetical protein
MQGTAIGSPFSFNALTKECDINCKEGYVVGYRDGMYGDPLGQICVLCENYCRSCGGGRPKKCKSCYSNIDDMRSYDWFKLDNMSGADVITPFSWDEIGFFCKLNCLNTHIYQGNPEDGKVGYGQRC